VAVG
jgi:hypothetical protein